MSDDLAALAELMRDDWNRRVRHDYRFWMSDGYRSDEEMWRSGERDYSLLLDGVGDRSNKVLLEIGCGIGRLLRPALHDFKQVIGIDVSDEAITKARTLLGVAPSLDLHVGSGYDLASVPSNSVDVAISFAALTSIPTPIIAAYLIEIHRVVRPGGIVRLQAYVGREQSVAKSDTLHLRCFEQENLAAALCAAGFSVQFIRELILPFEVSFKEAGIEAVIVGLRRDENNPVERAQVAAILLPSGEPDAPGEDRQDLECWMSINYARELREQGDLAKAQEALEYAAVQARCASWELRDMLDQLRSSMSSSNLGEGKACQDVQSNRGEGNDRKQSCAASSETFEKNMQVLRDRFDQIYSKIEAGSDRAAYGITVQSTDEGPVLLLQGQVLDHPSKPRAAAAVWAKRIINEHKDKGFERLSVVGFGCGYHVEELLKLTAGKELWVCEPSWEVFIAALCERDMTEVLSRLAGLVVGEDQKIDWINSRTELVIRPQTQSVHYEFCARARSVFYQTRGLSTLRPKIGVLGPLQGGTLPITGYSSRALSSLKQRAREIDVSGFATGYHVIEGLIKDDLRQATLQNTYLEAISQVILESINEKPVDILVCMAQAPISGHVLQELRKCGIITVLWFVEDYARFTYWREMAQYYDFIFTIQRGECISAIKAAGAGEVHYLPTACDPELHAPVFLTPEERGRWGSPVSFVGAGYHNRQQVFASLCDFPFKIWGTQWPTCKPFDLLVQEGGRRLTPVEYVRIFNASQININLHSSTERDGVDPSGDFLNPRTFELAAAGAFQLVDERSLLSEAFEPGKEVATFNSAADLKDKIRYYLAHPEERERIAGAGRERALREHTYHQRFEEMLSIIYGSKYEQLKRREGESPWYKLLERSKRFPELHTLCQVAYARGEEPMLDGLVADIVTGNGALTETEQKLLFLHHVKSQIKRMRREESGDNG